MDRVNTIQLRQEDQDGWNEEFIGLVSALLSAIEQCLIRQCSKAMRCSSWQRMDGDLRSKMQKLACLAEPDEIRRLRSSASSVSSIRNYSASSSVSSRTNDLRQVKLAIQAHSRKLQGGSAEVSSNIPVIKKLAPRPPQHTSQNHHANSHHPVTKSSTKTHVPEKPKVQARRSHSEDTSTASVGSKVKLTSIKSRYMDPKKPKTPVLETRATNRLQLKVKHLSSSESSTRGSSPAFNRRQNNNVRKSSNLSLDSLQSPSKQRLQLALKAKNENMELSIDSLVDSMRSSLITEKTVSSESLVKKGRNLTDETKLMKCDSRTKIQDNNKNTTNTKQTDVQLNNQIRRSFLSQKSREILAKSRKHSTNSNSSVTTKSTNPSPRTSEINKSSSSASLDAKKKVYNTTLHLRKTAKLPDPKFGVTKEVKKTPVVNKIASNIKAVSSVSKQLKPNPQRKSSSSSKIFPPKKPDQQVILAPIAKHDEDEVSMKMARSNTFSKETSDNPLELLEIIN
jgi:BTB/POZ domain-containing protein 8